MYPATETLDNYALHNKKWYKREAILHYITVDGYNAGEIFQADIIGLVIVTLSSSK